MKQISFRNLPGMSPLFVDYVSDWPRVQSFFPNPYRFESILDFARRRHQEALPHREVLCRVLAEQQRGWGGNPVPVEKLAQGAVAVVTGQQPGLFTGPMYTIFKAITAIRLSEAINHAGVPAVPVFWVAAEDHDYEEIHWASILDRDSALRRFRVDLANDHASPVGWLHFKEDVATAVNDCLSSLPQSEFQAELRDLLESAYRPGLSPVDSFARMMIRLFGRSGLILADPLHPELKAIAEPTLAQIANRNAELRSAVLARTRAVSEAGYQPQVKVDGQFTGLFALRGSARQALKPDDVEETVTLSPNVLVRPVIQDTIFPTAAFVAGPAEITYLAQAAAVYETLGREVTPVYPRISATMLESRVARSLKKYDLELADVFQGKEFVKRHAVETVKGGDLFANVKARMDETVESLRAPLSTVDSTLSGALDTARQKMMYQIDALETKFINAEARRNEVMEKQLDLIGTLFPEKKLQERILNVCSFIGRYGLGFVERLQLSADLDSTEHQIIEV